jgi:hypothetical protein
MHRHFVFRNDWERAAVVDVEAEAEANAAVAPLHTPPAPPPSTN